jgi:hypothetical protein
MRYVVAPGTVVALIVVSLTTAFAGGGPLHLYGPFQHPPSQQTPTVTRAGTLTLPSFSTDDLMSGCGRGRLRDAKTHQCRGPADVAH